MRVHPSVFIFDCIWFGVIVLFSMGGIGFSHIFKGFYPIELLPLGMLLFAYIIMMIGFKSESRKSIKDLKEAFEADILEASSSNN